MRINGAIGKFYQFCKYFSDLAPFKTLLTSTNSNSPAAQPRAQFQHQNAMSPFFVAKIIH
jgi:hypothetical protein